MEKGTRGNPFICVKEEHLINGKWVVIYEHKNLENMEKKKQSSTYLVANYLIQNKDKSYIHDMKKVTRCNNVGQRVLSLRKSFNWDIASILEGYVEGRAVWHYKLLNVGRMPSVN